MRLRRLLRAPARSRPQRHHRVRPTRRARRRLRRQQLGRRERADRRRRGLQDRALRPFLLDLQYARHLHRGYDRLPARTRSGKPRHRAGRARDAGRDHRHPHAAHPPHPPQRVRRRLCGLQQLRDGRRRRARAADDARRGHGHGRQGVRLQDRDPPDARGGGEEAPRRRHRRRGRGLAPRPGDAAQPALRARADEPARGAVSRLDLGDRHADGSSARADASPEVPAEPLRPRSDGRAAARVPDDDPGSSDRSAEGRDRRPPNHGRRTATTPISSATAGSASRARSGSAPSRATT